MIDRLVRGGTESQLVALIEHLDPARVEASLCLLDGEDALSRSLEPRGCPVLRLGVRSLSRPATLVQAMRLAGFLRQRRVDVLQLYFPDSTYLGVLAGKLAGVPHIVRTRNNMNHWMTSTHRWLGRFCNSLVTATLVNCNAARRAVLVDEKPRPDSVFVLENGVDLDRFLAIPPIAELPGRNRPRRVGLVANLRPVKGVDVLVEAAARVAGADPEVTFAVAGEGESRPALERRIQELGLGGRFTLAGSVRDIPGFLAGLDVAVLCSRAEGMPNAVLEYMAAGRAIVATTVGGTVELIQDGVNGLLVPPEDASALAGAIHRLLSRPELAGRLAAAARRRAHEHFSRQAMVRRFERFYGNLMGRRSHGN
jgi:glycosyltransferase involved in cell wall biosynthesis